MHMNSKAIVAAFCLSVAAAAASTALAVAPAAEGEKYVMINGQVVRYEPGKVIVVRGADGQDIVYQMAPAASVPEDVKVGKAVTLYTEPGVDGRSQLVSRVTTTSVTPEGNLKRTTEDTRQLPNGTTTRTTTTTTLTGRVEAYEAGKTISIVQADGSRTTYLINAQSKLPADLAIGKAVTIVPVVTPDGQTSVQTITYILAPQN
jgi:hypothetical protein